jgi:hypothetical protein
MLLFAMGAHAEGSIVLADNVSTNWRAGDYTSCKKGLVIFYPSSTDVPGTLHTVKTNKIFKCNGGCPNICDKEFSSLGAPVAAGYLNFTIDIIEAKPRFDAYLSTSSMSTTEGLVRNATWYSGNVYNGLQQLRHNADYYLFRLNDGTVFAQQNVYDYGHLCKDSDFFSKEHGCTIPPISLPDCQMYTKYQFDSCKGESVVNSYSRLLSYYDSSYGKDSENNYKNLRIEGDIVTSELDIRSPCKITVADKVRLEANKVVLDGRYGVKNSNGYTIKAKNVCLLSERRTVSLGKGSVVTADNLTIQGANGANIRKNSKVTLVNDLTLKSNGGGYIGVNTVVEADNLTIIGGSVILDEVSQILLQGDLVLLAKGALAMIKGGNITVGGDMEQSSEFYSTIFHNASIGVSGNFVQDGKKCIVAPGSNLTIGGSKTSC